MKVAWLTNTSSSERRAWRAGAGRRTIRRDRLRPLPRALTAPSMLPRIQLLRLVFLTPLYIMRHRAPGQT